MKKIGIITIQNIANYGNRLQNYAVERILESKGCTVESIRIWDPILWGKIYLKAFLSMFFFSKSARNAGKRTRNILNFNKKNIHIKFVKREKAKSYFSKFDYVFLGGDQLWAVGNLDYNIDGYRFGSLVPPEKRIPFGVSFGSSNISDEYANQIKPWLNQIPEFAIREQSGADIILRLTDKKATVLSDPIFGLDRSEWDRFAGKKTPEEKFAASFFLGGVGSEKKKAIKDIISDTKLKEINNFNDEASVYSPEEFVRAIRDSEIVFTDSFHCAAFAILFNKPFVVFPRENWEIGQMTRIVNLLKLFGLEDRVFTEEDRNWYSIDYSNTQGIITNEREKMLDYLDRVFGK